MTSPRAPNATPAPHSWVLVAVSWLLVALPLAWGIYRTLRSAFVLFR